MAVVITAGAVDLDREGRDPAYVESIVKRSQKIVDKLELTDTVAAREVTTIIANSYLERLFHGFFAIQRNMKRYLCRQFLALF